MMALSVVESLHDAKSHSVVSHSIIGCSMSERLPTMIGS
jgi:hypothetical protein